MSTFDPGRRAVLQGGALMFAFSLFPSAFAKEPVLNALGLPKVVDPRLPGSLSATPMLDAWIQVAPDGKVTVCSGKVELGTGVRTALTQIALEALALEPRNIHFIGGDTGSAVEVTPNEGFTAGSHTIADGGTALLHASSQVAALLRAGAAAKWGVEPSAVTLRAGRAVAADGRSMHYGEAVAGLKAPGLHRAATPDSPLPDPAHYNLIGKPVPRVDIPAKVAGGQAYVQDMRPPGMLHARVVRPPRHGARLVEADLAGVGRMPGVRRVVRDGSYLAVLATDEWQAVTAMNALAASARWEGGQVLPAPDAIHATLQHLPSQDILIMDKGKPRTDDARVVSARYTKQYLMHGAIGPSCSVGHLVDGVLTVWTHTQGVFPLRAALAELVGMPIDKVRCIHTEGSGCYGQNGADDVAADAALLARAVPGVPVRVQLMREQENMWEPFSPAMVTEVRATLDEQGRIDGWQYELWSGSHNERPGNAGKLVPAWLLAKPIQPSPSLPMLQPEGGGDRNALPLYDIPNARVMNHFLPVTPLRSSAMRSLGAHLNIVTIEGTMDRLAQMAGTDPVRFRLDHLGSQPRAQAVVRRAAEMFGWQPGARPARNHGLGFGFAQYKNLMGFVAIAVEIVYDPDLKSVRILRVACAADCGQVVNPDGARNQLEGAIVQSSSWTLQEHLRYGPDGIASIDWSSYPILRFPAVPERIEVAIIDQPGQPFLGVAEAAQAPMAAALANALTQATGVRRYALPLLGEA